MNAEEVELLSDSKYRNYVAAVDKALKNFEYSSEWADLISALGKLNKVTVGKNKAFWGCSYTLWSQVWLRPNPGSFRNNLCLFLYEHKHQLRTVHRPLTSTPGFAEQCKISSGS